jgi:hypothetical protein
MRGERNSKKTSEAQREKSAAIDCRQNGFNGGRCRIRTCDLLGVNQTL